MSGCEEEEIADKYVGKYEYKISIEITNYASNNITAIIEIYGENYSYDLEISIGLEKTTLKGFGTSSEDMENVDMKISVKYTDFPNISDTTEGSWRGTSFHHSYKVYGAIKSPTDAIIDIRGPL